MKYVKGLDTLRAFAVFFVILQHYNGLISDKNIIGEFAKKVLIPDGGFGVDLFFVLSGYLITSILLNAKQTGKNKLNLIKTFYFRRALRIFLIYYILLGLLFILNYPDIKENIWFFLTYTFNIYCYITGKWIHFSHT